MADNAVVHIGENSAEHVAYRLMENIAAVEKRSLFHARDSERTVADRKWILDTYRDCIEAVKGGRTNDD
jgi:hypothetical protein